MAEYAKKLHIRKSGVVTDIKLYTTTAEVGSNYLTLKDGTTPVYAKLGVTTDANASALRIRKGGTTYAALTQAAAVIPSGYCDTPATHGAVFNFTVPAGITKIFVYRPAEYTGGYTTRDFDSWDEDDNPDQWIYNIYTGDYNSAWIENEFDGNDGYGGWGYYENAVTIGVTPGKTYSVTNGGWASARFKWNSDINNITAYRNIL